MGKTRQRQGQQRQGQQRLGLQRQGRQYGLTLVELIATIVILSIALAGVSLAISNAVSRSGQALIQLRAVELAQSYLDEILGKRFDEKSAINGIPVCHDTAPPARQCTVEGPGTFGFNYASPVDPGENVRNRLDDVDDYDGMDEGDGGARPLQDAEGNDRVGYDNYRVQIAVRYIDVGSGETEENLGVNNELDDTYDAKLITVTVSYRGIAQGFVFSAYKANF